jgi:DNA-directed RNA polymerase alpha subunit
MRVGNIRHIIDLVQKIEEDLLRVRGLGKRTLEDIETQLAKMNLSLGMRLPGEVLETTWAELPPE